VVLLPGLQACSVKWIVSMRIQPPMNRNPPLPNTITRIRNGKATQEMPLQLFYYFQKTIVQRPLEAAATMTLDDDAKAVLEVHVQGVAWGGASGDRYLKVEVGAALY
jgi:hypothetical protein